MKQGSKKSQAIKNRRKEKKNAKRLKKEMEKTQIQQEIEEAREIQIEIEGTQIQQEIENNQMQQLITEGKEDDAKEIKSDEQKRMEFLERIEYSGQFDKKIEQIMERKRAEEADRKRNIAYREVVDEILHGEER